MAAWHLGIPALLPLLAAAPAASEVVESSERGFVTQDSALVSASPAEVWTALIEPARWWNPDHSWSGDSANFSLSATAGGCFCEKLPGGGSVEHMRVIHAAPGSLLRMSGALGPLQSEALVGTLTVELKPEGPGTRIGWTYIVGAGHSRIPLTDLAGPVDPVQSEQLRRLARVVGGTPAE